MWRPKAVYWEYIPYERLEKDFENPVDRPAADFIHS
jgi:hypothetical protein